MEKLEKLEKMLGDLALSQKKTDEQLRETSREIRESQRAFSKRQEKTDEQIREMSKEIRESQRKTDEQIGELRKAQRKTDEQIGELQKAQRKTDEKLKSIGDQLAGIGFNNGDFAEKTEMPEIFFFRLSR